MFHRSFFGLALAAAVVSLSPASLSAAAPTADRVSVSVPYGDLNLASVAGQARFHARVRHAAAQVCGTYDVRDLRATRNVLTCRSGALAAIVPQVQLAVAATPQPYAQMASSADRAAL